MKMKVWMAQDASGNYLCDGNPNPSLSYHISHPFDAEYLRDSWLFFRTKAECEECIRKWHDEARAAASRHPTNVRYERKFWHCRPVRVTVSWEVSP